MSSPHQFVRPPGEIYLDGNSLGLACDAALDALSHAIEGWKSLAIRGWTDGPDPWFGLSRRAADLLAPLLGADPVGVAVSGSTTANLHQLLATFYDPNGSQPRILIEAGAFPTDRYAVESHIRLRGLDPRTHLSLVEPEPDRLLDSDAILAATERVGFAVLPTVVYTTGQLLDVRNLTQQLSERGVVVAWDCSHSAGAIDHHFAADGVELAFGCGYKYLNGGPGAVGWLYVRPDRLDRVPGLAGWFGSDPARQFEMSAEFHPAADASRYLAGTPHVFSLAPLVGALALLNEVGMVEVRRRSLKLTAFLREIVEHRLSRFGIPVITPREPERRGGHLALAHPHAGKLSLALRQRGVVPDFRPPDILRLAPAPLSTTEAECEAAVDILFHLLDTREYLTDVAAPAVT